MAKGKKTEDQEQQSQVSPRDILSRILKDNEGKHYNDQSEIEVPLISSGSLILDSQLGGGFGAGLHRFVGFTEGGKTSAGLEVMKNFLKITPNGYGLLVKAEGRLSKEMQ